MAAIDRFAASNRSVISSAIMLRAVEPDDDADLEYVSTALVADSDGVISLVARDDAEPVSYPVVRGVPIPVRVKRVLSTGTTATGIVALIS